MVRRTHLPTSPPGRSWWLVCQVITALLSLSVTAVFAEDTAPTTIGEFRALQAEVVKAAPMKSQEPGKKTNQPKEQEKKQAKKVEGADGYDDAPEAGDPPPAREAAVAEVVQEVAVELEAILEQDVDANVANLEKQFLPQFTSLMTAELSFINRACDLNLAQRKKIKASSEKLLRAAVRKYALTRNGMMRGHWRGRNQSTMSDPTNLVQQSLAKLLQQTLRADQQRRYDKEIAERIAVRKRVAIQNVVVMIDDHLVLTVEQRKELTAVLDKNWQDSWGHSIEMLMSNNQYMPSIPDRFVTPILSPTQKTVWRTAQKHNYTGWGGFGWGQNFAPVDDFPLEDAAAAAEAR